jgi:hypothetical protein
MSTALPPGTLLATDAATATTNAGPCRICSRAILRGDRFARLLTGRLAHLGCIGTASFRTRPQAGAR